jgi:hypothetical protein
MMKMLSVGQLAKDANVNIETVRYYERRGLLPEPKRRESGYREDSPEVGDCCVFCSYGTIECPPKQNGDCCE